MSTSRPGDFPLGYSAHTPNHPRSGSPSANNSPIEPSTAASNSRPPFGLVGGLSSSSMMGGNPRSGAGSPSHDLGGSSRLFSKRAREIQAQEGVPGLPLNLWGGPPTSGNSTPLRENIPESPTDGFPDFGHLPTPETMAQPRRARAGTVPSRFSPGGVGTGHLAVPGIGAKSARNTPSQTPFNKTPSPGLEPADNTPGGSALLSRLRAGSLPQRSQFAPLPGTGSPFGPSIFSSWNPTSVGRERGSTLASIASVPSNGPSSPSQSHFSREGGNESDVHMRTLDYLGLAETPQPALAQMATPYMPSLNFHKQPSRIRSYSVNNKDIHADEYPDDEYDNDGVAMDAYAALQQEMEKTQAAIRSHNLAVQAYSSQASSTRRRARTAGVLDAPHTHLMSSYFANSIPAGSGPLGMADMPPLDEQKYDDLSQSVASMSLGRSNSQNAGLLSVDDQGLEGPTSALWLGNIPTSTTRSTLAEMFKAHGPISSVRVLTHKNCGFVNYERVESAISAKAALNGKELFPGASPIRINFAKPVSPSNTPGHDDGAFPSPSPDPFAKDQDSATQTNSSTTPAGDPNAASSVSKAAPTPPVLRDIVADILEVIEHFDISKEDRDEMSRRLQTAAAYDGYCKDIPSIPEPPHGRVYDAPKLRELRKRIDHSMSAGEIDAAAIDMLPEIAGLASDYLGNTVVQKLWGRCSEEVKDQMLEKIAPHMAKIGTHKNGTWAAQMIIKEILKDNFSDSRRAIIAEHMRPFTPASLVDQYGNYVVQCCLPFGLPHNNFIFEALMSRMTQLSQDRFAARAMRGCLESPNTTKQQQKLLLAQIVIHSVHLATDQNGALLLTWYLDTWDFPHRRRVLAPRLVPHLVYLCTHKVAYLTVLKVINQTSEPEAQKTLLDALFFSPSDQVLEAILRDSSYGATLIFKVLTSQEVDESIRAQIAEKIKAVLLRIKPQSNQGYRRLMDEVGLPTNRNGSSGREAARPTEPRQRPTSRHANGNGHHDQQGAPSKPQFHKPSNQQAGYDMGYGQQRNEMADANVSAFPPFNQAMMYNGANGGMPGVNMQQAPYQQNMMGRGGPPANYNFPPVQPGYGAYGGAGPSVEQYRQMNMPNGSPIQPPATHMQPQFPGGQGSFAPPPGFGMPMGGQAGYGYGNMGGGGMPNVNYGPQGQGNRRNHVRRAQR